MIRRIAAVIAFAFAATAGAQMSNAPEPGSQLTVFLLTMGPGDEVWEKFGHNAIWIHDELNHTDIAYHWGLFDFNDKDFVPRFIQGRMRYSMGAFGLDETIDSYRRANRTVYAQKLNLTPAQKVSLAEFVAWNIRPENRFYHYDYFRDNCSTRVRDALARALGGVIKAATDSVNSKTTYRFHTARLTQDDWPVFTGTMMGLGHPVDREISAWEEMFLPVRMMKSLRSVRVPSASGTVPLVQEETVLFQATRPVEAEAVHRGIIGYLAIAAVILLVGFAFWIRGARTGRLTGFLWVAGLWSFAAGLGGTLLTGLWAFTDHLYSYRNENLLQLNPLSAIVGVLLFAYMWKRRRGRATTPSALLETTVIVVAALSLVGFVWQVIPVFDQVNGWVIALALPLHLGLAAAIVALKSSPMAQSNNNK